ncbi:Putative Sulfate/bicarbonate/oxalate exchanger SAT-1 and related transporters [Aspergillus calidoustus]|uniref:Putative Sulfate/bicarbonate/oxalate exchanger SAT-1 and related transporters n=1 Tax=Aspergillus calidoustus TaxID=454130 RepID=A0A0U5GPE1_ASPCI|nr:Putative Sulfate/bicarbonate/oxalate exchanger SAT-1 and related transporters [Aspergillus calidoustus]
MGVLGRRYRGDSRASLHRPISAEHIAPDTLDALAEPSSFPRTLGSEPVLTGGTSFRTPSRSFYHRSFHNISDPAHYSSHGLREKTAELASFALSREPRDLPPAMDIFRPMDGPTDSEQASSPSQLSGFSQGLDETGSRSTGLGSTGLSPGSSVLTAMIRDPSSSLNQDRRESIGNSTGSGGDTTVRPSASVNDAEEEDTSTERTSLLTKSSSSKPSRSYGMAGDVERQAFAPKETPKALPRALSKLSTTVQILAHPKAWDARTVWRQGIVHPLSLLPSVFLGLLLNILDALSYGMILFPLGEPIFSELGSDGISMFYVSTIIAQLVFSCGGSIFRGGIGSEMIEVVPFFHQMAFTILNRVGEDNPKSVIATTILAFSVSSVLTGLVFFLMGTCKVGSLIGFFPRHILIGCIGGVGFFLILTGLEVSARLPGSFEFNLPTLQRLFSLGIVPLWIIPLSLAIGLLVLKRFVRSNFLVGAYFIAVALIFYMIKFSAHIPMASLRNNSWVFDAPSSSNPWYHFYTLYDFAAVDWPAFVDTIPAMFALTFFGILHVPINVPALGISTGEDNLNVDRELIAHGVTNALSGFAGSIQNYLVYTNSLLFIDSGGNSRLAGLMLAGATAGIMLVGPVIVGFIPVMVVGALIFLLGIELMEEALVDTWGKLHRHEYLTVVIIVATMGIWDFVTGILVGIILACLSFVVQTSRKSAIRATYSGKIAGSTVRRPPIQHRFLKEAGRQTLILKLGGYLFFGTIVDVENTMRGLIEEEAFSRLPIRFIILDLSRVYGIDFSAAEAFTRINRILKKRNVQMTISGLDVEGDVGKSLQNVGLFEPELGVRLFEDLNSALEYCENDYLNVFYSHREALLQRTATSNSLEVPVSQHHPKSAVGIVGSPRHQYLQRAATTTLSEDETAVIIPAAWSAMRQPLPLLLQTFQGLTSRNEDFWFPACSYFVRENHPAGTALFQEGDIPNAFYLLESGMLRAEYELPQGRYFELIVAGRPCGELPFFSETPRTATVKAEQDCVTWSLDAENWKRLREGEPAIARELLTVSLKLTTERMDSITSYVLTMAA